LVADHAESDSAISWRGGVGSRTVRLRVVSDQGDHGQTDIIVGNL